MFQSIYKYFKKIGNSNHILAWKPKGLSDESIKPAAAFSLAPTLNDMNTKLQVKFDGSCLKKKKVTFSHEQVVNICIAYKINLWPFTIVKDFALQNLELLGCLKMLIFININILDMVLDLMHVEVFPFLMVWGRCEFICAY